MAEMKTKQTSASVDAFLDRIPDAARREDCRTVAGIMERATGAEPRMWGESIVGFGQYHYRYESGREGDWFLTGFSPRKKDLTLYISSGLHLYPDLLRRLGKHSTGKSCLYIKSLADLDRGVLDELISTSVRDMRQAARARAE